MGGTPALEVTDALQISVWDREAPDLTARLLAHGEALAAAILAPGGELDALAHRITRTGSATVIERSERRVGRIDLEFEVFYVSPHPAS